MDAALKTKCDDLIAKNPIVLFIKGTKEAPQCGFSARVVQIFKVLGANFADVNILDDMNLREGMKVYSNWPTFPQVYVNGEFIGGCDIVTEMYDKGELHTLLQSAAANG